MAITARYDRSKETRKNSEYSTGTTSSVRAVAKASPNMIVIAIGTNIAVPPHNNGIMPSTVVAVVSSIGLMIIEICVLKVTLC